jgi:MoaA/NifB/PqqE/SkfB family radical SAM enzyme
MPIQLFKNIVDHLPPVDLVSLNWIGEPLLHPKFPEMLSYAKASGKFQRIRTCTNGLTRSPDYLRDLFARGLESLSVSVDSLDPEVAERCRSGTKVQKLRENLRGYAAIGFPILISTVVSNLNFHDIPALMRELNQMGSFVVHLQPLLDKGFPEGCMSPEREASLRDQVNAMRSELTNLTFEMALAAEPPAFCMSPWTAPSIDVDGNLGPCCKRRDPEDFGRLNVGTAPYAVAWQNPDFQRRLENYLIAAPEFCRGCPSNARPIGSPT